MPAPLTPSEQFTFDLCTKSFLSLWCYNNPLGKKNKELCDILVICDPDILIFSVKEVSFENPDIQVDHERWQRKAIEASLKQLYGASQWLQSTQQIVDADRLKSILLPPIATRSIHRIAVAFGSRGECSISSGNFGKGHVHVFTERTLIDVLTELDTIKDFVNYLSAKETFMVNCSTVMIDGSESDLLGIYIHGERSFPKNADFLMIQRGVWDEVRTKPEFKARKTEDNDSYTWDELIESLAGDQGHENPEFGLDISDRELLLRGMAREDRFSRRILSKGLLEFLCDAKAGKTRSRIVKSLSHCLYIFAYFLKKEVREKRLYELYARCLISRYKLDEASDVVIGIGFNEFDPEIGSATDLIYVDVNTNNNDWRQEAQIFEKEFGYFRGRPVKRVSVDEFPHAQ